MWVTDTSVYAYVSDGVPGAWHVFGMCSVGLRGTCLVGGDQDIAAWVGARGRERQNTTRDTERMHTAFAHTDTARTDTHTHTHTESH